MQFQLYFSAPHKHKPSDHIRMQLVHDFSSGLHRNSKALFEAMLSLKKASSFPHLIEVGIKHKHILHLFSTKGPNAFLAWTIGAKKSWQPNNATTRIVNVKITNNAYHNQNLMCNMPTQSGKGGHYEFSTKQKKKSHNWSIK